MLVFEKAPQNSSFSIVQVPFCNGDIFIHFGFVLGLKNVGVKPNLFFASELFVDIMKHMISIVGMNASIFAGFLKLEDGCMNRSLLVRYQDPRLALNCCKEHLEYLCVCIFGHIHHYSDSEGS